MALPKYNEQYAPNVLKSAINRKHNIYEKRHLELEGKSVTVVSDGYCDVDKEIQSELKNAGLQNILKLQEMRYGTVENAIARANDRGVYADVSDIPDSVGERAEYVARARNAMNELMQELGLSQDEINGLTMDQIITLYEQKNNPTPQPANAEGGQE